MPQSRKGARFIEQMQTEEMEGVVQLKIRWQDAHDLPTLYANQVYISHAGGEFYVLFGELQQPVLINVTPDELAEEGEVPVKPVAKLVFTPECIATISEALQDNVRKYWAQQQLETEEDS